MKIIFFSAVLAFITTVGYSQKKINEGSITYTVEWQPTAQNQQFASRLPSELTTYFKGDSSATLTKTGFFNSNMIVNAKAEYQRLLIDAPMIGKKLSVKFSPDELEASKENNPEYVLTATTETKTINGYTAQKYTTVEKKTGKTFDAWFTKDIAVSPNSLSLLYDTSYGFPLEFQSFQNYMPVKVTLKEFKEGAVPPGFFSASKEYEEITLNQLMNLMGGGRR